MKVLACLWMHLDADRLWLDKEGYLTGWTCFAILAPAMHGLCGLSKSFSFHSYSSYGHGGTDIVPWTILRCPQKLTSPTHWNTTSFPFPLLPEYDWREDQVCAGRRGWQDSHSFPAPGGKNRGHSSDDLLLSAFVCFVLPFWKETSIFFKLQLFLSAVHPAHYLATGR